MSCGVGHRHGSDPRCCGCGVGWQLQLIGPLAWEPPYSVGAALKRQKKKKKHHQAESMALITDHMSPSVLCWALLFHGIPWPFTSQSSWTFPCEVLSSRKESNRYLPGSLGGRLRRLMRTSQHIRTLSPFTSFHRKHSLRPPHSSAAEGVSR